MGKSANKLKPSKMTHPNSRKTKQLIRHNTKVAARDKKKLSYFMKLNTFGEKMLWFKNNADPNVERYSRTMMAQLIHKYLSRFDDEMDVIKSVKPYERQRYASRENDVRHTIETENQEYNGCGFEVPDMMNPTHLEKLRKWNGELRFLQNLTITRCSKKQLEGS